MPDYIEFISYAFRRHCRDGHAGDFEHCRRQMCRRARQLEIYLILTGQWIDAAYSWLAEHGRG